MCVCVCVCVCVSVCERERERDGVRRYVCIYVISPHGTCTIVAASGTALLELPIRVVFNIIYMLSCNSHVQKPSMVSQSLLEKVASTWHCTPHPPPPRGLS